MGLARARLRIVLDLWDKRCREDRADAAEGHRLRDRPDHDRVPACGFQLAQLRVPASLGAAAVAIAFLGARLNRPALEFHGLVYLLAASIASGLPQYAFRALAGALPGAPSMSVCLISVCAVLSYAAGRTGQPERWTTRVMPVVSATLAVGAAAAMVVEGLMGLLDLGMNPAPHHLAFVRTLTLCAAALALAFSGVHWRRMDLTWIGYATLVLVAAKLVFEDLRQGHLEFVAASIFLFAVTLIAVPRIAPMGQKARDAA